MSGTNSNAQVPAIIPKDDTVDTAVAAVEPTTQEIEAVNKIRYDASLGRMEQAVVELRAYVKSEGPNVQFSTQDQVLMSRGHRQRLLEIQREHSAIMPIVILNELLSTGMINKGNITEKFSPIQLRRIDNLMDKIDTGMGELYTLLNRWSERNHEWGFPKLPETDVV